MLKYWGEILLALWILFLIAGIAVGTAARAWAIVIVCAAFLPINSVQLGRLLWQAYDLKKHGGRP